LSNKEVIFSHDFRAGTESNVSALKVNFGAPVRITEIWKVGYFLQ
jgi:hypothetical protein